MRILRWSWLLFGLAWVIAVFYVSLMPDPPEPVHFWGADKFEHALTYSLLMLWFCQVFRQRPACLLLAAILILMGCLIEFLQLRTGYRFFEYADILANSAGVMVGWAWARTGLGRGFAYLEYHVGRMSKPS